MKRNAYVILILVLLVTVDLPAAYGQTPSKSEELRSVIRKEFEIYAARPADLERASEALHHSRRVYQKYFGKEAPKMALVLFDDPAQASAYDDAKFRERGIGLLKWPALGSPSKIGFSGELGVIITQSTDDGRPQVLDLYPQVPLAGANFQKGDKFLAINKRQVASIEDLSREITATTVGNQMAVRIRRQDREMELKITKIAVKALDAASITAIQDIVRASGRVPISKSVIAHEAMHKLMREGLDVTVSINIPAWFSEALASLAETPEDIRQRRIRMIENLKERIPLAKLFTLPHPASGGTIMPSEQPGGEGPVRIASSKPGMRFFYEQSMTLLSFFADAEGDRFVGRIGEGLARGESMESLLRTARKVPVDPTQLEEVWIKWLNR